jgi:ubiquinone biosynthesis protein
MKTSDAGGGVKRLKRFSVIAKILVKHGLGDLLDRTWKREENYDNQMRPSVRIQSAYPSPKRIRRILEELGPSFIKLGQLMSTRADIFPAAYLEEFKKLQDQVPPIPFDQIESVIEKELARSVKTVFAKIEPEAMAAASVAQVHLAQLVTGEHVVIKVIRPGIQKKIREDIRLMYYFAEKIQRSFEIGRTIGAINLVKEFERTIFKELDMFIEAGSMEKFTANFKDVKEIYIPKVYWHCTSKSVLVMEHIDGIKMDRVAEIISHDIDPKEIAMIGLRSFSRQLMEFGFFHADPHPGNTIVMYDGRVSLVDFGITGYLDEETMLQIANIFLGYAEHDYDMIIDAFREANLIDEDVIDLASFRIDLKDISEPFYGRSLQTISVMDVYDQVMQLLLKYQIRLPRNLLLLFKTLIQTEALGKILGSDASILEVTRPYAKKLLERGYEAQKIVRNLGKEALSMKGYMKMMPKYVYDIFKRTATGHHRLEVRHTGFQQIDTKFEKGINRLTVGLVISASLIAASLILNSSQKVIEFKIHLLGLQTISVTAVLGLVGYSMATVLGFWLIISIFRSGKL